MPPFRRFVPGRLFEEQVRLDVKTILQQTEPPLLSAWLGPDGHSAAYPPHKVVRLASLVLCIGVVRRLRVAMDFMVAAIVTLVAALPLGAMSRVAGTVLMAIAGFIATSLWLRNGAVAQVYAVRLFWRKHNERRDFSTLELSRVCHVFNAGSMANAAGLATVHAVQFAVVLGLYWRFGWLAAAGGFALFWIVNKLVTVVGLSLVTRLFSDPLPDQIEELATMWEEAGLVPGDRASRSPTLRNLQTGRALRLPSRRGALAMAFAGQVSAAVALVLVFVPIAWLTMGSWWAYTPASVLSSTVAIWLLTKFVRVLKASDHRQFRSVLVRPFRAGASAVARHAITPVMGSVGRGMTVEDRNFTDIEMVANPNFMGLDVITGDDCVVPYVTSGDWRTVVEEMIRDTDAVVVDVSEINENLRWEIDTTLAYLPAERLIFVARGGDFEPLRSHLASKGRLDVCDAAALIPYSDVYLRRLVFRYRLLRAFKRMS